MSTLYFSERSNYAKSILLILVTLFFAAGSLYAASGNIKGTITDAESGDPLAFANIVIKGTTIGTSSDLDGNYVISNVPAGEYIVTFKYIGFKEKELTVTVVEGRTVVVDVVLLGDVFQSDEVVISAQAKGQQQAINEQISSVTAKNVVSAAKIQELPEANAAEAVGRLPGVSLQREGGEGTKVVLRGLSPRYSKVQLEGVSLASTDDGDRSTDLSMISSSMLEGIELTKAATADQEGDQIGGTVNFKIKDAPEEPTLMVVTQGGFNGITNEYDDYKFGLSASKRFFDNRLGVIANIDLDRINRSEHSIFAGYEAKGDTIAIGNNLTLTDVNRIKKRYGGSVVLDYRLPDTKLKLFSMFNLAETEMRQLQETFDVRNRNHIYTGMDQRDDLTINTTSFEVEHDFGNLNVIGGVSYTFSRREIPNGVMMRADENNGFLADYKYGSPSPYIRGKDGFYITDTTGYLHPKEFNSVARNDTGSTRIDWIFDFGSKVFEEETAAHFSVDYDINFSNFISLNLEVGGKYKSKFREYDYDSYEHPMWWSPNDEVRRVWYDRLQGNKWIEGYTPDQQNFPYAPFLNFGYESNDFLNGEYELNRVLNMEMVREYIEIIPRVTTNQADGLVLNFNASIPNDYKGDETYYGIYILPTLKIGQDLTFIPGLRYERNETKYGGVRTQTLGQWDDPFAYDSVVTKRTNEYFLPMVHIRYNVIPWFDIKASYTKTLSRPSYNLIIPTWVSNSNKFFSWNNPNLKPLESQNFDLTFSLYSNKIGLFSLTAFQKTIKNFIYNTTEYITEEDQLLKYPDDVLILTGAASGFVNNPNDADLWGFEVEWQSNFWFLPGAFSGLVFGVNYTYTQSEIVYPFVKPVYERTFFGGQKLVGSEDASYKDRLIDQPDHVLNLTLGFDYEGFSIRGSMRYKSGIFMSDSYYDFLVQETDALTLFDLSVQQKLPVEGLKAYLNISNLGDAIDTNTNRGTGWFASRQFYGRTAQFGLRYNIL